MLWLSMLLHLEHTIPGIGISMKPMERTCWFWLIEHSTYFEFGPSSCPEQAEKENACRFRWQAAHW